MNTGDIIFIACLGGYGVSVVTIYRMLFLHMSAGKDYRDEEDMFFSAIGAVFWPVLVIVWFFTNVVTPKPRAMKVNEQRIKQRVAEQRERERKLAIEAAEQAVLDRQRDNLQAIDRMEKQLKVGKYAE